MKRNTTINLSYLLLCNAINFFLNKNKLLFFGLTITVLCFCGQFAHGQLSVSENGRYLVSHDNTPFLWLGDTGWGLFQKLNREEVDFYLKTRAEQSFSVIHAAVVHKNPFIVPELENIYGDKAFEDEALMKPAITEGNNPKDETAYDYWDHVDYIIEKADEYGIYILFLPLFGMAEDDGYNLINEKNAYSYGKFLGSRYKERKNIIWCMGGDVLSENENCINIWNLLAKGVTEGVAGNEDYTKTLMSYHIRGGHTTSESFMEAPWLDFNMNQTWDLYTSIYSMVSKDYNSMKLAPILHGEGAYEDGPEYPTKPITPHKIRKQAYWATFAGGLHTYGNSNIWSFGTNPKYVTEDWKKAIFSEGARSLSIYTQFMKSIDWWSFIPDQTIIVNGVGAADSLNVAMRSGDKQIMVYLPEPAEITLDLKNKIKSKKLTGEWINPKTGDRKDAGKFKKNELIKIHTPEDWEDALFLLK
ncbi:DUF4038 domain-containing protein [Chondrinema litorale]|uniref:apiosidase-like domain-containing protein n=1 Tax=Chondrinema litorale TaxID=2994555 RepID=UPI002542F779|nr:DUF4038 domain-containing protein [Chondrinema litorale]UZR96385.1 DUF4038 domain-containing protein [Chondrinema litorale]